MTANHGVGHELVERYLDDLARMLDRADPGLRAEVLGGVREHVDAALAGLGRPATESDVWKVLGELGPPEAVAQEALDGGGHAAAPAGASSGPEGAAAQGSGAHEPVLARGWVPPLVTVLLIMTVPPTLLSAFGPDSDPLTAVTYFLASGGALVYLPAAFLVAASPLWRTWRTALALVVPFLPVLGTAFAMTQAGDGASMSPGVLGFLLASIALTVILLWMTFWWAHVSWRDGTWRRR